MIFYRTGQSWFPRKLDSLELGNLVLSYAIPNHELLPKACLAASPTPHSPEKTAQRNLFHLRRKSSNFFSDLRLLRPAWTKPVE